MRRGAALVALSVVLTACPAREPAKPAAPAPVKLEPSSSDDREERKSLAGLVNGATVLERTGEAYLAVTPVNVIDGNPDSYWMAPPKDMPQSVTIALAAKSRLESVGMRSDAKGEFQLRTARIETASGNGPFAVIADVALTDKPTFQFFKLGPVESDRVRVTMLGGSKSGNETRLDSVVLRGAELGEPTPRSLAGSWSINGRKASFAQIGSHVIGQMEYPTNPANPMHIEGGAEGNRMLRLAWIRGGDYGVAAVTVSPDGKHLSGIDWHEDPIPFFYDEGWFGERTGDTLPTDDSQMFAVSYIRRTGRWPLYGIAFKSDGTLDVAASEHALALAVKMISGAPVPVRLVSREFREASPAANLARSQKTLDALRAELTRRGVNFANVPTAATGSDNPRQLAVTDVMRSLYSSVDLEIRK
jgi:hypothetical protein